MEIPTGWSANKKFRIWPDNFRIARRPLAAHSQLSELARLLKGLGVHFSHVPCHRSRGRTRFRRARVLLVPPESFLSQLRGPVEDEGKRRRADARGQRQEKAFSVRRNVEELARGCDT